MHNWHTVTCFIFLKAAFCFPCVGFIKNSLSCMSLLQPYCHVNEDLCYKARMKVWQYQFIQIYLFSLLSQKGRNGSKRSKERENKRRTAAIIETALGTVRIIFTPRCDAHTQRPTWYFFDQGHFSTRCHWPPRSVPKASSALTVRFSWVTACPLEVEIFVITYFLVGHIFPSG